jgi:NADPH2:quinone reductase
MMVLFGGASGQVAPFDIQRLNRGGSLFLTRPTMGDYIATRDELEWRTSEILGAVADGSLKVDIGGRYPLAEARAAYDALAGRQTTGKLLLIP